jgi:tetratricopeptide (TPR) repeat protein
MPLRNFISTKWRFNATNPKYEYEVRARGCIAALLFITGFAFSAAPTPAPDSEDAVIRAVLDRIYRMDYPTAEQTAQELPAQSPARPYFAGLACMNRFLDWGDTAALRRAESWWERLSPHGDAPSGFSGATQGQLRLYRGLVGFQLSYAASLRGQRFRSAGLAFAAQRQLQDLEAPEARASRMLYDYYSGRILESLPFVGKTEFNVPAFTAALEASPYLREMFLGSLFWIHMDHRRFDAARAVVGDLLGRYPDNRLARQMRGDALFKAGKLTEARDEYEKLRQEYAALTKEQAKEQAKEPARLPLGYYRCVGNLARIQAAKGDKQEAQARVAEWNRALGTAVAPWLPPVLKRDLARL